MTSESPAPGRVPHGSRSNQVSQQEPQGLVKQMEDHQVAVYLGAMAAGAVLGWAAPAA
jgi:hypothetical protein